MPRKKMNDQGPIIEDLKNKDYNSAWLKVLFIGTKYVPDEAERFLIFSKACRNFKPEENNNFILFYKNYIYFHWRRAQDSDYDGDQDLWPDFEGDTIFNRKEMADIWRTNFDEIPASA